ncbi:MAG TPA: polyprenyl diphosphate synthase, partial [Mizugakiibacter sp.]
MSATTPEGSASAARVPRHVAIVMDGNGRWAEQRHRPRSFGHRAGQKAVREAVEFCLRQRIEALTLFAFSSENWQRPQDEVGALMELFLKALDK